MENSDTKFIADQVTSVAMRMKPWLIISGVVNIIQGVLALITIWGVVFAWIPIWLGVLLFQAAGQVNYMAGTGDLRNLVPMLDKIRLYFLISGILIIVGVVVAIVAVLIFGSMLMTMIGSMPH